MKRIFTFAMIAAAMAATAQADVVFYESFNNLNGQGGNDGYFDNSADGTVEVGAEIRLLISSKRFLLSSCSNESFILVIIPFNKEQHYNDNRKMKYSNIS